MGNHVNFKNFFILSLLIFIVIDRQSKIFEKTEIKTNNNVVNNKCKSTEDNSLNERVKELISNKTVIALVFYGRKPQVTILMRYLERNLKVNGGVLDKVIFAVRMNKKPDLEFLDIIIKRNETYYEKQTFTTETFVGMYDNLKDEDLVFKIDDDILFISNGTFEKMLEEYLTKNALFLSGNVINHTALSHVHARLRAILPFYQQNNTLLLDKNKTELDGTEAGGIEYRGIKWWNCGLCAAMTHASFIHHYYNDNLDIYDFKRWDFHTVEYVRWSINFILFRGKYVKKMRGIDDEEAISNYISKDYGRHAYALGSAIVSHFAYFTQFGFMSKTNLMEKYDELSKHYFGISA